MVNINCLILVNNTINILFSVNDPFVRLNPIPGAQDFYYSLLETEGISDLFDVPNVICCQE